MRIHHVLTLLALAAPTARAQRPVAAVPLDTSALSAFADSIARGTFGKVDGIRVF